MNRARLSALPALLVLGLLPLSAGSQTAADSGLARPQHELERLAPLSGGTMGVGVVRVAHKTGTLGIGVTVDVGIVEAVRRRDYFALRPGEGP